MSKKSFDRDEILKCCKGEMFGTENLRLPMPNMLMLDRIINISTSGGKYGNGEIQAEFDIHQNLWFFECHFEHDPIMPGSLGMDGLLQLVGFYLGWIGYKGKGRALGVGEIRFRGEVLPNSKKITYNVDIKRVRGGSRAVAVADGSLSVDGELIGSSKDLRVGVF